MNFLFLSCVVLFCVDKSFGIGYNHGYENDLSLLLSNGMKLGSFRDSLHKIESRGHKISSLACTSDCDSSCNEDCDSCASGCDSGCDGGCDGSCVLGLFCDSSCDSSCDSDCDSDCDSESCNSGCTESCDETCGDEDAELVWLLYMDEFGDHIADRVIDSTSYFKDAYLCYNNDSKSDIECTDEFVSIYDNDYLSDVFDDLRDMIVDDSYSTGLSLSVGFIDDSKTVFSGILQSENKTFYYVSESDEILSISNNNSYFGTIGFWWDYSDITSTNYFLSEEEVNISGCDWSMGESMTFNQDTVDWVGMIYGFAYDSEDDDDEFVKQYLNISNVDTVTIDISEYVSNSSSSSSLTQFDVNKLISNSNSNNDVNDEWILSNMINNNIIHFILIISLIIYIVSLKFKMNGNKELEYQQL